MKKFFTRILVFAITFMMLATMTPVSNAASKFEAGVSGNGGEITVTRDGYTYSTNEFSEEDCVEGSCLKDLGYTNVEATNKEIYKFIGWYPYVDGEIVEGAELLTTKEMLNYKFPNKEIWFYAQWQQIMGGDIKVGIFGNEGEFKAVFSGDTYTTLGLEYGEATAGSTLRDIGYTSVSNPVHPNGNVFLGWKPMQPTGEYDEPWTVIEGAELLTANEMLDYVIPAEGVYFYAKWDGLALPGEKTTQVSVQGQGGTMDVVMGDLEFSSSGFGRGDAEPGSTLRKIGYSYISTPVHPDGKKFEGWCAAEYLGYKKGYKVIDGAEYLTTEEMMNYPLNEEGIVFLAQWEGVIIEDVFGAVTGIEVHIQGGGGEFNVEYGWTYDTSDLDVYYDKEGSSIREEHINIEDPVHPEGYKFLGWRLYEKDGWYYNKTDTLLTTEQVMDHKLPDGGVMFAVQWEGQEMADRYGGYNFFADANGGTLSATNITDSYEHNEPAVASYGVLPGFKMGDVYTIQDPVHPDGKVFEGWCVYEWMPEKANGAKRVEDQRLLTTEEMLNYECTDAGLLFLAQWKDEYTPKYYGNINQSAAVLECFNGSITYTQCYNYSTDGHGMEIDSVKLGMTVKEVGSLNITTPVHPKGLEFGGWALYKEVGEGFIKVDGIENMTTEEMLDYVLTDYSVMFRAEWLCDHSYTTEKTKATTSANGFIVKECSKCGERETTTIYRVAEVSLSDEKYAYDGTVKKPEVTVKDAAGNVISSDNYTVKYSSGRKVAGTYKVEVSFKGDYSGKITETFDIYLESPENVKATLYGTYNKAKVSWSKVKGATGYYVYYRNVTSGAAFKELTKTTSTSYTKSSLTAGATYEFKLIPYYKTSSGKYIKGEYCITDQVTALKTPAAPTVEVSSENDAKAVVKWANDGSFDGYEVSKNGSSSKTTVAFKGDATAESAVIDAAKGRPYYYKVRGYVLVGSTKIYSPWSKAVKFNNHLDAPATVKADLSGSYNKAKVTWSKVDGATGYYIYYKKATATKWTEGTRTTKLTYSKSSLTAGTTYDFKVVPYYEVSKKKYVKSENYRQAHVTTLKAMSAPTVEVSEEDDTKVVVGWNGDEPFEFAGYEVSKSTSSTGTSVVYKSESAEETVAVIGATKGKPYYYKVRGYILVGTAKIYTPWSKTTSFNNHLEAPEEVTAELSGTYNKAKVTWSKVPGATGYYVYYKKATATKWTEGTRTTKLTYSKSSLSAGTTYDFKVVPYYEVSKKKYVKSENYRQAHVTTLKAMSAPTVEVSEEDDTKVVVKWVNDGLFDGYEVSKSSSSSKTAVVYESLSIAEENTSVDAAKGRPYYYKVRAYITVGTAKIYTPWSKTAKFNNHFAGPETVEAKLTGTAKTTANITWSKVEGATGYYVYYRNITKKTFTELGRTTKLTYSKTKLTKGATYEFKIVPYYKTSSGTYVKSENFTTVQVKAGE